MLRGAEVSNHEEQNNSLTFRHGNRMGTHNLPGVLNSTGFTVPRDSPTYHLDT
jgi:hypothetical protein